MATTTTVTQISIPKFNAGALGDTFLVDNGTYDHTSFEYLTKNGIIVKAKNKGKAVIKGAPIGLKGAQIRFEDFDLQYAYSGDYVPIYGAGCIVKGNNCHFANTAKGKWFVVNAPDVSIEQNEIHHKTTMDTFITCNSPRNKIRNNYIHDLIGSGTPMEAIREGASSIATQIFNADISGNKFERINADTELMTIKCCNVDIHDNEFVDCNSSTTFRHGRFNKFRNNKLFGVGLRIYGKGHEILNNKFKRNPNNQLRQIVIGNGKYAEEEQNTDADYTQVRDCIFQNNEIELEDSTNLIGVCWGYGDRNLKPTNNKFIGNKIAGAKGTLANTYNGGSWNNNTVAENVMWAEGTAKYGDMPTSGYTKKDWRIAEPEPLPPEPVNPGPVPPITVEERLKILEDEMRALKDRVAKLEGT